MAEWDKVERRKDNWTLIVREYAPQINTRWKDREGNEYSFFGLVHGDDDYYYGLVDVNNKVRLATCVGALASMYEAIPPLNYCSRCGIPCYANTKCMSYGCPLNPNSAETIG